LFTNTAAALTLTNTLSKEPVLVVIDVQQGFKDPRWGANGNPAALDNIGLLVEHWRGKNLPIVLVKHNSRHPDSPLFAGNSGNDLEPFLDGPRDVLIQKSVNSAFYGTPDLHLWLSKRNFRSLVICGITTNRCCETTARMAGNLGYNTTFVIDATDAFDLAHTDGSLTKAADVMRMTAANLDGEFAKVQTTQEVIASN
jgi:nicotinamidase-related amidase